MTQQEINTLPEYEVYLLFNQGNITDHELTIYYKSTSVWHRALHGTSIWNQVQSQVVSQLNPIECLR